MRASTVIAFVVALLVQVGYPLAVTLLVRRRTRASWHLFGYGAAVFAAFQLFTWLPVSVYLDTVVGAHLASEELAFLWLVAMALTTSLLEEGGRWVGYRYLFPRRSYRFSWRNGVMYGLGHGSLETIILIAGLTFIYFLAYLLLGRLNLETLMASMTPEDSQAVGDALRSIVNTTWDQPLVVAVERVLALPHQVAWALLVMQSRLWRQKRWFGYAVLYHFTVAVMVPGLARLAGFAVAETVNAILAAFSLWIILRLRDVLVGEE